MTDIAKKRIGLVFGGRSEEHEISVLSASSVAGAIDKDRYEVVPVLIAKDGSWHLLWDGSAGIEGIGTLDDPRFKTLVSEARPVTIAEFDALCDFAFPALHGPYGEDGTIQGLFEMLGKPYAGCGVASSAITMDKIFTKQLWENAGLPVAKYLAYAHPKDFYGEGGAGKMAEMERIAKELGFPLFVKPANLGSSVGITRVTEFGGIEPAFEVAFRHDFRVIAEKGVDARELEVGLLGDAADTRASVVGEVLHIGHAFYDYESKYSDSATEVVVPADIPGDVSETIRELVCRAYRVVGGDGFARVDLFYEEKTGNIYLNELNSIPGFTQFSMFPSLWGKAGLPYAELVEWIIEKGYERYKAKNNR
ncbi:MAG: D-alanine--D-alanine ligase [Clostridiales Family XIII bacterium]|jgi:D-alanine-D-alanine ligase|nr:D-alanine--D-alanine ligase [Clostridiales Family XIII bacterium]